MMTKALQPLGWLGIVRLGLVQTGLGAIVILTTSTLNRVMVVELALPAVLPGALVAFYYAVQLSRPRMGYGSDVGGRRTPWIIGGMACLALGGILAALATAWMASDTLAGIALAIVAFAMIGAGVGAAGTSLLVLLAMRVAEKRRAAAATIVWLMMIAGFIVTAAVAGQHLDPFSNMRLIAVTGVVALTAFVLSLIGVWNIEGQQTVAKTAPVEEEPQPSFAQAMKQVWAEPMARRFAVFVFVSMLAYSAQDLILEPFAGLVFGLTPGQSTQLAGVQNAGLFVGMVLVALAGSGFGERRAGPIRLWMIGGCVVSALALVGLVVGGQMNAWWPLHANVFVLGVGNGAFAVGAIGSMMGNVSRGTKKREGVRMGLWGAAQAIAFGVGGLLGAAAVDITRLMMESPALAYGAVFAAEAVVFLVAAHLATRIEAGPQKFPKTGEGPGAVATAELVAR